MSVYRCKTLDDLARTCRYTVRRCPIALYSESARDATESVLTSLSTTYNHSIHPVAARSAPIHFVRRTVSVDDRNSMPTTSFCRLQADTTLQSWVSPTIMPASVQIFTISIYSTRLQSGIRQLPFIHIAVPSTRVYCIVSIRCNTPDPTLQCIRTYTTVVVV